MDPAYVIGAFLIVLVLVVIIGTPYRNSTPRQKAVPAPRTAAPPRPTAAPGTVPPPAPGHRYVIHNGTLVQVRNP